jgi:hypothetical protein
MGIGIVSISTTQKKELVPPPGPPFVNTSAANGLSVDPISGKIVLGNNVGGVSAQLLSDREIPSGGFNINLSGLGNIGVGTVTPAGRVHAFSSINNTSMVLSENGIDGTGSSAVFRAMIGGGSITELGTTGSAFTVNPNLAASGYLISNATNGVIIGATGIGPAAFRIFTSLVGEVVRITTNGNTGIGVNTPTAFLHIKPGTAAVGSAPIKLNAGVNLAVPETGALEWNGANVFFTNAATRQNFLIGNDGAAAPATSIGVAIVNFYGTSATNFLGTPNSWAGVTINGIAYKIPLYT